MLAALLTFPADVRFHPGLRPLALFYVTLRDGRTLDCATMRRGKERLRGKDRTTVKYADPVSGLMVEEDAIRRGTYTREVFTLTATKGEADVERFDAINAHVDDPRVVGQTPGSPIVTDRMFMALEHPIASNKVEAKGRARCGIDRKLPVRPGSPVVYSAVFGSYRPGQLRRDFLAYLEAERPRRYKPFLHYNSWYDIGYFTPYTAAEGVERIGAFAQKLTRERGVRLASFLFDDGWDEPKTVWEFNKGFPQGFAPLTAAAKKAGAAPGMWLSPWGGYGPPRDVRLTTGKRLGYEIDDEGYALSGPRYYARFHDVTTELVRKYGINQFKLDGTGSPDKQVPGSAFASDFDAAIALIGDLRREKPGLFINLTTGTWPSPFWTRYADSIWRGGEDHDFAGVGPDRERWITYRDGDTYHGIVQQGPLFPLNSLMLHGVVYAQHAHHLDTDPSGAFRHEVRDYFGTGTQLQELYVTPSLLTKANWNDLAEAAKWSADNAKTLVDTHWVGGDPTKLEVYGFAAWSPSRAILTLRNPSDKPQSFSLDLAKALEVPSREGAAVLRSPWKGDRKTITLPLEGAASITLEPFEVVTLQGRV